MVQSNGSQMSMLPEVRSKHGARADVVEAMELWAATNAPLGLVVEVSRTKVRLTNRFWSYHNRDMEQLVAGGQQVAAP